MTDAILVTADGEVFRGRSVGAPGVATGEVVFNTAMTGYQEILTDPSYAGQVVVMTAPHIGNYGTSDDDVQASTIHARGLITRAMSAMSSSWRSSEDLRNYLARHDIVAMTDVDTRRLTRHIRDRGAMPIAFGSDVDEDELSEIASASPSMVGQDLVSTVTTTEAYTRSTEMDRIGSVVAYDFGIKRDILDAMNQRGLDVTVVPASTPHTEVLERRPDAVFLSNGPGDPEPLTGPIESVRGLLGNVPVFGICLGHQVLGLALGATTFKLPFGHHGGNHPVRRMADGRVEITSQNHGFAVDLWSLSGEDPPERRGLPGPELLPHVVDSPFGPVQPTHQNLNDGTNEGLRCLDIVAYSVQYHPEAAPGPNDASVLFDRFAESLAGTDA
jgi:carbamoyl-phosphate synthase small subunit